MKILVTATLALAAALVAAAHAGARAQETPALVGTPVEQARIAFETALRAYNGKKIRTKKEHDHVEALRRNYAVEFKRERLPPPEYDHPYAGNLTIERVADPAAILVQCPTLKNPVGCAKVAQDRSWCKIYIVSDEYINSKGSPAIRTLFGYSYQNVLRHEIAHCNGWPSDHPRKIETTKKETTP